MPPIDPITLTRELIAIPSESSNQTATDPGRPEEAVRAFLAGLCQRHGIPTERLGAMPGRDNFIAFFPAANKKRLLLTAHMDTVSAAKMENPFAAALEAGKIKGRGACDDKGPLACAFAALVNLHAARKELAWDVTFAATVDEECSMSGAAALAGHGPWDLIIGLEPTGLQVITAHKGVFRCTISTTGHAVHSSIPEKGRNAIMAMHDVITDLKTLEFRLKRQRHPDLGRATLAVTQIEGGSSVNIIPDHCRISVDVRLLPEHDPDSLARTLSNLVGWRGEIEETFSAQGIFTDPGAPPVQQFLATLAAHGHDPTTTTAAYATDCSRLSSQGPCIIWGPGDISQAHQVDEYIEISEIEAAGRVLTDFLCMEKM